MSTPMNCLFITFVEREGPFLKLWGQTDKSAALYIEQVLHGLSSQFDSGLGIPRPESLQIGVLCCAKYKDNKYYRSRIINLNYLPSRYIEVNFIDYGHRDIVPVSNIRFLEGFDPAFSNIPAQAASFVLAEAVCARGEWDEMQLEEIRTEIRYCEVHYNIIAQVGSHFLVKIFVRGADLSLLLISKGYLRHTTIATQEAVILSMMPKTAVVQPTPQQNIATYKAYSLEAGCQYEVYVSFVTDGPCNFSVQLKQSEEVLAKLMKEINSMTLNPIEDIPIPGTVCLARCMEDGHICRAVVTNEVDGQFKVYYVDFGNYEVIPLETLYEIPFKFVIPKVMAIRFALAGVDKSTVTLEMQCAFKQFVDNRLIHMKVLPSTTRTALPRCELWDPVSQISALDIVTKAASASYPDHVPLNRGFSQAIKVSYVSSCNKFYVQLKSKQDDLLKLMLDIQVVCREGTTFNSNMLKVGLPCYALYAGDQQWYRSEIVEILDDTQIKVHYVDYGNDEVVYVNLLKPIEGKQLTILRPQAIECCLNGYQNMEPDLERDNLFEELILEQEFTMKVVEMQGKKALVELIDSANYNVASLLLDKIAITRSQVSPMLVQAGNKIEHRKLSQPFISREPKIERKPDRNRDSVESNENNENNSWRQNNKGFNKYDRSRRDEFSDSNDSEKQNTKGLNNRNRNDYNTRNTEGGSWNQNKGFNKNQDRFNKDNNRNNDWGDNRDERKNFKEKDDWGSGRQRINSPDDDGWGSPKESGRQNYNSRGNKSDWGNDKRNFKSRENNDWGDDNTQNEKRSFKARDNNDWGGDNTRSDKRSFKSRENNDWGDDNTQNEKRSFKSRGNDDWGGDNTQSEKRSFKSRGNGDWGGDNTQSEKRSFKSRGNDDWGGDNTQDWGGKGDRKGFQSREDNFRPKKRFEDGSGDWGDNSGGYKKREYKRDTSEMSSSGSEKSFRKGSKDNFRKNKPDWKSPKDGSGDGWNVGTSTAVEVPNPAPSTAKFKTLSVDQTEANVTISWFHNPSNFYCQIESTQDEFKQMMSDIQLAYKGRKPGTATVGAPVIGLFPEDGVLYRAEIVEVLGSQYKIYYVDFGNVSVIDKVWPIEMRFMELPAQAICCKLSGILAPGDAWPDASHYSQYFDKKQFLARFISTEDNRVAIQLECNNEDIASLLLRDGLATALASPPEPELPLLIGQMFRALVLSVNSLADFSVSLQSGILLQCGIFNLSESKETWEETLKEKINQILIVYVDDLKENTLQVTLYDENGQKIKLIDNDEGSYETVELLVPYLILHSKISGEITHVDQNTVYIQPADCAQNIDYLLQSAFDYYDSFSLNEPFVPTEGCVYAVKGSDSNWYRARVASLDDKQATVNYIDYGNSEQVNFDDIRDLVDEFAQIPILCVPIIVKDATEDLVGQFINIILTFTENGIEGTIEVLKETEVVPEAEEVPQMIETSGTKVVLSHTDTPSDFYLQLAESIQTIEQLQARLQDQIPEMVDMENPVTGVLCAAQYSLDQQWYRAQVLDGDTDITTVRFVDYGNTDVLDNHTTRVKTLPPDLLALEVHATRCRLEIKPVDEEWSTQATERFEQLASVENLTAQFISQDEKTNYVELFSDGINVREVLIQENLALPDEIISELSSSVGFVSHLNSPSEFWIQLENCVDDLEWVAEQLSGAESFPPLEDLAPGLLCAALFADDQMWYRARILSNTVAGIEVLFIDYGNSCMTESLKELPEELVILPPLAQKCSLQKPEGLTVWGPEMVRKFSEISADGQTTFNVKKLGTGETASVVLLLDGIDVTTLIVPQTEEVQVKSFDGFDEIVLVKNGAELEKKFKLEPIQDVAWSEDSVEKFADMNNEGNTIFQAEYVGDDTVRLYLGLNDIRLELNGIKAASQPGSPIKARLIDEKHSLQSSIDETLDESPTKNTEEIHDVESTSTVVETPQQSPINSGKKVSDVESKQSPAKSEIEIRDVESSPKSAVKVSDVESSSSVVESLEQSPTKSEIEIRDVKSSPESVKKVSDVESSSSVVESPEQSPTKSGQEISNVETPQQSPIKSDGEISDVDSSSTLVGTPEKSPSKTEDKVSDVESNVPVVESLTVDTDKETIPDVEASTVKLTEISSDQKLDNMEKGSLEVILAEKESTSEKKDAPEGEQTEKFDKSKEDDSQ